MVKAVMGEGLIEIPEGVEVAVEGKTVWVRGALGELKRDFSHAPVTIKRDADKVRVEVAWPRKKEAALVGTICSHIKNMIIGVTKGFTYKLKIAYAHFPISVKIEGKTVKIENFTGERSPRIARIIGDVKVGVEGDDVVVKGINVEEVGQTASNIEQATKVKKKDPRVFLDGIYVYEKGEGM
jgi:large subunit ribosomal protein L6